MGSKENDFGFYGEEADEENVKEIEGITDKITDYTYTNLTYPCFIFKDGFTAPKHKMVVISNMVKSEGKDKNISLYFKYNGDLMKMGTISGLQVSSFLEIVGEENVNAFYDDGKPLVGSKKYVLCTF